MKDAKTFTASQKRIIISQTVKREMKDAYYLLKLTKNIKKEIKPNVVKQISGYSKESSIIER